jgi:hypothetical protein
MMMMGLGLAFLLLEEQTMMKDSIDIFVGRCRESQHIGILLMAVVVALGQRWRR